MINTLSKIDKLKKIEVKEIFEKTEKDLSFLKNVEIVLFSSKIGEGVEELKNKIESYREIFKG